MTIWGAGSQNHGSSAFPLGLLTALALSACAVGPSFKTPPAPAADTYTREALPAATLATPVGGGESQRIAMGQDLPGQWWLLFGSPQLSALVSDAMANYPDVAAQQAALRAAREDVRAGKGVFLPQIDAGADFRRQRTSGANIGPGSPGFITNIFQATVDVSYTLDVFGGERRALEGLMAQADAQNFQLEASYLTLTSNVAATVIQLASLNDQIAATHEIIAIETRQLDFIRRRFEVGSQTQADVLQQQSNLAVVRATLPALEQQQAAAEHQLAVLTGRFPKDLAPMTYTLSDLKLPQDLPVSLPSALVAQRPDIKVREAVMRQANASVGVATANLLPQLTLTGSTGYQSLASNTLFQPGSRIWSVAAGLSQPIFAGGTLRARRRAAIARYEQASAQYRLAVLQAFQNVADTLTSLNHDAQALSAQSDALTAARASLDLIQRQYDAGAISYVSLLSAQQVYSQARIAYVQAIASRYTDTVTLFQALGGGWWNRTADVRSGQTGTD